MSQPLVTPEVVDTLFQNLKTCLPEFVPALPSIKKGLIVTVIIVLLGIILALIVKKRNTKQDILSQSVWVVVIIVSIFLGANIGDSVKDRDYVIRSVKTNKQHYSNIHWLKQYVKAFRGASST